MSSLRDLDSLFEAAYRGRDPQAAEALAARLPTTSDPTDQARIHLAVAAVQASQGDVPAARRSVDRGILLVPDEALDVRLELLNTSGILLLEEGRPHAALGPLLLVPRLADEAHAKASARAVINLAFCLFDLGDLGGAADWAELAWDKRDDGCHDPAHALWVLTDVAWRRGDGDALERCERRLRATRPSGEGPRHQRRVAARAYGLARTHLWNRRWDAALQEIERARAAFTATSMNVEHALCDAVRVLALRGRGDDDLAWTTVRAALARPGLTGPVVEELHELEAGLAEDRGDATAAIDAWRRLAEHRKGARDDAGRAVRELTERHLIALRQVREIELTTLNATLERTLVELEASREELQRRVAERTHDLEQTVRALSAEVDSRRNAEEAARAANQTKSLFLARMSHELRTPLTAIQGYAEILEEEAEPGSREDLRRILTATAHLLQMIDELLDLVRIESGELRIADEPFDLKVLIDETVDVARVLVAKRKLAFEVDRAACPQVTGDAQRTRQVLLNLISNAVKFTPTGTIRLQSRVDDANVWIAIQDTGIGIAADDQERIFRPFEQVDPSSTRTEEGTGLGLAIARHLMRSLDGDLLVESALGVGSTFTLRLPR